jgi:hypothetical protein
MRYLTLGEILHLYHRVMTQTGGAVGVRDLGALGNWIAALRLKRPHAVIKDIPSGGEPCTCR